VVLPLGVLFYDQDKMDTASGAPTSLLDIMAAEYQNGTASLFVGAFALPKKPLTAGDIISGETTSAAGAVGDCSRSSPKWHPDVLIR